MQPLPGRHSCSQAVLSAERWSERHEQIIEIPTADGRMETFVTRPEAEGPLAPVVIYMDVWGLREEVYDIATCWNSSTPAFPGASRRHGVETLRAAPKVPKPPRCAPSTPTSPNGSAN